MFIAFPTNTLHRKNLKKNCLKATVVHMDFAEDYSCRSQDEVQTAHFNMTQVTLHPVVIYFKHDDSLQHKSIAFVSDEPRHDANFVFGVLTELIEFVRGITD